MRRELGYEPSAVTLEADPELVRVRKRQALVFRQGKQIAATTLRGCGVTVTVTGSGRLRAFGARRKELVLGLLWALPAAPHSTHRGRLGWGLCRHAAA